MLLYARQSLAMPSVVQQLVKYSWCFWEKCEDSGARSAEKADVFFLREQGFRDANIAYGVGNTRERTDPLSQENRIISHYVTKCTKLSRTK